MTQKADASVVRSVDQVTAGDAVQVRVSDGTIFAKVERTEGDAK